MRLRAAKPGDASALDALWVEVWRHAYVGKAAPAVFAALAPHGSEEWERRMTSAASVTVAEDEAGDLLGYCWIATPARDGDLDDATAEIAELNVSPDAQRQGIGRTLLQGALERLKSDPRWQQVVVWTLDDNHRSLPLYEAAGFTRDGSERTDPGWLVRDVRLRLEL